MCCIRSDNQPLISFLVWLVRGRDWIGGIGFLILVGGRGTYIKVGFVICGDLGLITAGLVLFGVGGWGYVMQHVCSMKQCIVDVHWIV